MPVGLSFRIALLWTLLASTLAAQLIGGSWEERRYHAEALPRFSWYGASMVGQVDVDLDGVPDQIIGASSDNAGGMYDAGSVFVYSGVDGALLHHFRGPSVSSALGWSVASTDLDGDGHADILAGAIEANQTVGPGRVYAWSGATGQLLYEVSMVNGFNYGERLAVVADRNQDQIDDFLVGCSDTEVNGMPYAGHVDLRSGADGTLLYRWFGGNAFNNLGAAVTEIGDVTGDGIGEFAFGLPAYSIIYREGAVQIVNGATYQVLKTLTVTSHGPDQQFGISIADPGDVNGDGIGDLLVGATSDAGYTGRAYVFDGASQFQVILYDLPGQDPDDFFGDSLCGVGDIDQDGCADFLVGRAQLSQLERGFIELYSGRDGSLMKDWEGDSDFDRLFQAALAGDINGDGDPEIMLGAWLQETGPGYVKLVGLDAFLYMDARTLSLSSGVPIHLTLNFPPSEAGRSFALLMSSAGTGSSVVGGLEIPLSSDRLFQAMVGGWLPPILTTARGSLNAQGDASADLLAVPALASMLGRDLFLCAVSFDASTRTASMSSISRSFEVIL